jgi:hypothetical protein
MGTNVEMEQRKRLLETHAVVITEEGPLGVRSGEEVKDIISLSFGIRKHNFYVYHTRAELLVAFFHDTHDRDVVFAAARAVDGPIVLSFHAWDLDRFGDRALFPYHVRIIIEGTPHHAWYQDIVQRILCDEAIIRHVDEDTERRTDMRAYQYLAVSRDPSKIPQIVFLSMTTHEADPRGGA